MSAILLDELPSRRIRTAVVGEAGNVPRQIRRASENDGGFLGFLWKAIKGFGNFVVTSILPAFASFGFTVGSLIQQFVVGAIRLLDFNWQITDKELDSYLKQMEIALYGQAGETVGNALGYLVCGVLPAAAVAVFNEKAALFLLKRVGEEGFEEFIDNMAQFVRQGAKYLFDVATVNAFKNGRRMVKNYFRDPNSAQSKLLENIFGDKAQDTLSQWGNEGNQPWTIRKWIEDQIEKIEDPRWETFWEEAFEAFLEGCMEAGYVLADATDDWIAQSQLERQSQQNETRVLEVYPDRESDERIVVAGGEQYLRQNLPMLIAQYNMLENRDIGQFMGEPVFESTQRQRAEYTLRIKFRGVSSPPWLLPDGKQSLRTQITIPDVDRSKIDWQQIKAWSGGNNGYLWGRFKATLKLRNNQTIYVYGGTADEAEDRAKALWNLTTEPAVGITILEETRQGARLTYDSLYKPTTRVYPASFTIFNRQKVLNEANGRASNTGVYRNRKFEIPLWVDEKPDNFDEIIAELFRSVNNDP